MLKSIAINKRESHKNYKFVAFEKRRENKVCIVTTMYKKTLSPDEEISIRHLRHFLGKYDKYVLVPDNHPEYALPGFIPKPFPAKFFASAATNADLLFSRQFHEAFLDYKYIMLYEIDCLVFSDQLMYWVAKDYDYIGAPWFKSQMLKRYDYPDAVGNGGFALRKVDTFLKVLENGDHPWRFIRAELKKSWREKKFSGLAKRLYDIWRNTPKRTPLIEDRFWSFKAKNYYPGFKVAPVEEGLKFAFEVGPRYCFERNGRQLPFGCHAWAKYDRNFWEPYLLKTD